MPPTPHPAQTLRRRRWLFTGLSGVLGLTTALAIGEVGARLAELDSYEVQIYFPPTPETWGRFDSSRGWANIENHGENNLQGFRFPRNYTREPRAAKRIVLLGDSQVWGMGVEASEHSGVLMDQSIADTEVLPFGVPGYGPVQEWLLLREILANYRVHQVFAVAFVYNDLVDESVSLAYGGLQKPYLEKTEEGWKLKNSPAPRPVLSSQDNSSMPFFGREPEMDFLVPRNGLKKVSALYRTLLQQASYHPQLARTLDALGLAKLIRDTATATDPYSIRRIDGQDTPCWHLEHCPEEHRRDGLLAVTAAYVLMAELCNDYGIPFAVVLTPSYPELQHGRFDVIDALASSLEQARIRTVDLRSAFQSQENWREIMGEDRHWTAAGHRIVAGAIERLWNHQSGRTVFPTNVSPRSSPFSIQPVTQQ